jgi:actin-like protein 6A
MCELMFESMGAPALFVSKDAVLECYACGRTSGLVIDIGASATVITPVADGFVELKGLNRSAVGGRYMDAYALHAIRKHCATIQSPTALLPNFRITKSVGPDKSLFVKKNALQNVHSTYDAFMLLEMGRDMKETVSRVADAAFIDTDPKYANLPLIPYELPDGTVIDIGVERFQIPELLFDPSGLDLYNQEISSLGTCPGQLGSLPASTDLIARLVNDSILRCDNELYATMMSNLVVAGGGSAFEGMPERIKLDVEKSVHGTGSTAQRIKIISLGTNERALTAWLGGSILASLGSFHEMWVSRQEYEEFGAGIVDKKCP